jgi:energy-coupling factor transport system substrate-specific component
MNATGPDSSRVFPDTHWRTRDIVVAAVIGVAFGVVFAAWNAAWGPIEAALGILRFLFYGPWLLPAILAPLIIRKPGAAVFAEIVAASVSTLFGSPWGPDTLLSGFVQGAAAELVFAMGLYRNWSIPVVALAAIASAAAAWVHDWVVYYQALDAGTMLVAGVFIAISSVVIVAGGALSLERSLRRAGVLEGFPG